MSTPEENKNTIKIADVANESTKIIDLVNESTTKEEFEKLIEGLVTSRDIELFGEKAKDFIIQAILFPAVFAQATFGSDAYACVVDDLFAENGYNDIDRSIDPDRVARLLTVSLENGVVELTEVTGRLLIKPEVKEILYKILMQYE